MARPPAPKVWGENLGPIGNTKDDGGVIWANPDGSFIEFPVGKEPWVAEIPGATKLHPIAADQLTFEAPVVRAADDWSPGKWVDGDGLLVRYDADPERVDRRNIRRVVTEVGDLALSVDPDFGTEVDEETATLILAAIAAVVSTWNETHEPERLPPDELRALMRAAALEIVGQG